MATRSHHIILSDDKKSFICQYVHFDGYPSHRLPQLKKYYNTPDSVKVLFNHGPFSSMKDGVVDNAYGESNRIMPISVRVTDNNYLAALKHMIFIGDFPFEEYAYFFDGKRWHAIGGY